MEGIIVRTKEYRREQREREQNVENYEKRVPVCAVAVAGGEGGQGGGKEDDSGDVFAKMNWFQQLVRDTMEGEPILGLVRNDRGIRRKKG